VKILLVHNFYGSSAPSGENSVFIAESELLRQHGHNVVEFTRHSDEIRKSGLGGIVRGALSAAWNPFMKRRLRRIIEKEQPDIMHVHNTFPLLSPAVFYAAKGFFTATILTVHNYRIFCAAGIPVRNEIVCTECLDQCSVIPALRYGCYRNSRLATLPMIAMIALHRKLDTWGRHVDAFIALTDFQREKLIEAGLPKDRVYVKPHFYPDPPAPVAWQERQDRVVYVGRLGAYKGVHLLVEAWQQWGSDAPKLEIIGEGPERKQLEQMAATGPWPDQRISFVGQLSFLEAQARLAKARLLVLPSLCFEGFPMVIREAFALGVPVVASRIGALEEIVDHGKNGVLFTPGSSEDLLASVKKIWKGRELESMARAARETFEEKYTAEKNYRQLVDIYEKAIARRTARIGLSQRR
jgi:glycosyltransferase involved in cell wall biosynthesis